MKKRLLLLIGIIVSLNFGIIQNSTAQGNRHHQQREHREQRRDKAFRHDERRQEHFDKHERRDRYERHERREGYYRGANNRNERLRYNRQPQRYAMPFWASAHRYQGRHAVYFRDYNAFYDPYQGGYVYWLNGAWVFSPTVPLYMANFDLNRARVHIIKDVPYGTRPELYYRKYARRYPRNSRIQVNIALPPY